MAPFLTPDILARATSFVQLVQLSGIDPRDTFAMVQVQAEFNALPFHLRKRITDRDTTLPDVPQVKPDELDSMVRESRWWTIATQLAAYFGDGRPLTARGNPKLVDCRALVELIGTDDLSPRI